MSLHLVEVVVSLMFYINCLHRGPSTVDAVLIVPGYVRIPKTFRSNLLYTIVMAALSNIGGALCSTLQSLADATSRSQPLVGRSSLYCKDMWGDTAV